MTRVWIIRSFLVMLTFYVSGASFYIHTQIDHEHHPRFSQQHGPNVPAHDGNHSHQDQCPFCQSLLLHKVMTFEPPICIAFCDQPRQTITTELAHFTMIGYHFILFSRPPPVSILHA